MHKPQSNATPHMKEKDVIPSSQEISSSLVSTESDPTIQSEEKLTQVCLDNIRAPQKDYTKRRIRKIELIKKMVKLISRFCIKENI